MLTDFSEMEPGRCACPCSSFSGTGKGVMKCDALRRENVQNSHYEKS